MPLPPQPIPYQGSKRRLAPQVLQHLPRDVRILYEPFAGSAAVTVAAAQRGLAQRYVLGDSLAPLVGIWDQLLSRPQHLARGYARLWHAQLGQERAFFDQIRAAFNSDHDPVKLLYLLARCVKNAVRFNAAGAFNQSPDRRRRGVHPDTLERRILTVHHLLAGRTTAHVADYAEALRQARPDDVVYLDPPYMGVSGPRDARYHQGLDRDRFVDALRAANQRGVRYVVSYDGRCGTTTYGPPLPEELGCLRLELDAGPSSQATLHGRRARTVESLYLSPALHRR